MQSSTLREHVVRRILPRVQTPAQYMGEELNAVVKDRAGLRGTLCLAFPDLYTIGMSHHGLQVLYSLMNRQPDWACERVFAPAEDMEALLREESLPLYSLETFTPLSEFDVVGFTLQYELCGTGVLTILDLGRIPLRSEQRTLDDPLIIAGGPCVQNPEPLSTFVDLFVLGDGEPTLPRVANAWIDARRQAGDRIAALRQLAIEQPSVYVPRLYGSSGGRRRPGPPQPLEPEVPATIVPAVVSDLDAVPLPTAPIVPYIDCVQDRISLEIMRGCPWRCRFCQSTTSKRPLRYRHVETLVEAALASHRNTGHNEVSLLSLSTSDYPYFDQLITELERELRPLDVSVSVPSLRVNEQLRTLGGQLGTERRSGLTLAPEAARESMRRRIGKQIRDEDLFEGCRLAFEQGFQRVKLYFMCGLPDEQEDDLRGIVDMANAIADLGKSIRGRPATVVASVSNFVPKPNTPLQWLGMQTRQYFADAHRFLYRLRRRRSVDLKIHDLECSLLEGALARGNRTMGEAIYRVWQQGARLDAWSERLQPALWWQAMTDAGVDVDDVVHHPYTPDEPLPWDLISIRQGRDYLLKEMARCRPAES